MPDPPASPATARDLRLERALVVVLLLGMLASLPLTVRDFWDARPDAARYLLAARSLADGAGYTVMGEPFRLRPPGFSLLLAPLVAWRGFDFAALNLLVSLFGIAAAALLYLLLVPRLGALTAFAVAVLTWLNPQLQALCNQVMSDVPALALALLALLCVRRANERPSLGRDLALVGALAAAVYVRSANLLLVPAFVLDRTCRYLSARAPGDGAGWFRLRRLALPLVLLGLLYAPWVATPSSPSQYDSPDLQSYSTAFLRSDPNDPAAPALAAAGWRARVLENAAAYAGMFTSGMTTRRTSLLAAIVASLGVLALSFVLLRRREAPEWFALGMAAVLVAYYVAALRLLLPVFVIAVGAMAEAALWLLGRVLARRTAAAVVATALLVVGAASLGSELRAPARAESESLRAATRHVAATIPPDAALGGDVGAVYALLLERPVYSLRPLSRRAKDDELFALVDQRRLAAIIARREGPFAPVIERLRAAGSEVVVFPHHVVAYLAHGAERARRGRPRSDR